MFGIDYADTLGGAGSYALLGFAVSAGCGYLDPPEDPTAVRVLYDEGEGAVRLFVARQWIPGEPAAERYHAVSASAENAFLHQQTLNASGGRDYQTLSARGASALGLADAEERPVTPQELLDAEAVFLTNSLRLVRPVHSLDGRPLGRNDAALARFFDILCRMIAEETGLDPREVDAL